MRTPLSDALDRLEDALSYGDEQAKKFGLDDAARAIPRESAASLRANGGRVCALADVARERGLVFDALPLMRAFEHEISASALLPRGDADEVLMGRAIFESEAGEYAAAVRSFERLLARPGLGRFAEAIATTALGSNYSLVGDARAVDTLRAGLARIVQVVPPGDPVNARAKVDLARAVMEMEGRVLEAEALVREALPLLDHAPGIMQAFARDVLGRALQLQGKYDMSRACFEEALTIVEKRVGAQHPAHATALGNLGMACFDQGDYLTAERLMEQSYAEVVRTFGEHHPATVPILLGLLNVRVETGDEKGAERLLARAQTSFRARPNDSPPQAMGYLLGRLGDMARRHKDLVSARAYFEEAARLLEGMPLATVAQGALARIRIQTGDPVGAERECRRRIDALAAAGAGQTTEGAFAWLGLAAARLAQREWRDALECTSTAIGILESSLGPMNSDIALFLQTRACAQIGMRDFDGLAASLDRMRRIEEQQLVESLAVLPAGRRDALLDRMRNSLMITISAHLDYAPFDAACETAARALLITRKGISGEVARQRREALRRKLGSEEQRLLKRLNEVLRQVSAHLAEPDPRLNDAARANLTLALTEEKEALERKLPPAVHGNLGGAELNAASIASRLAPGEAFIDYVLYQTVDPVFDAPLAGSDTTAYGAYWVTSDGDFGATRIASGATVIRLVDRFFDAMRNGDRGTLSVAAEDGYRMLFGALPERVARATHLRISPDGVLYMLPFAALKRNPDTELLHSATITYVDSARDLFAGVTPAAPRDPAVVIGDPDYYAGVDRLREDQLHDVPGDILELAALRATLPRAIFLTRGEASKQKLMSVRGPIIVHVSTHGMLFEERGEQDLAMAQSAIALAGYNDAERGISDGVLTGLEASLLDLDGCELVTLSACVTGLGRVDIGQGVLGLRRGLQIAGSRSQVVSLWPVHGEATARFMAHFYRALAQSLPREEAMREAQVATAAEYDSPIYWAPFVLFGARGPIPP